MAYRGRGGKFRRNYRPNNNKHPQSPNDNNENNENNNNNSSVTSSPNSPQSGDNINNNEPRALRRPHFIKVSQLEPGTRNLNLIVKPVSINVLASELDMKTMIEQEPILDLMYSTVINTTSSRRGGRGGGQRTVVRRPRTVVAEAVVGDETGTVIMTLTHPKQLAVVQEALNKGGESIVVRGGRIELFKMYMRLHVEPVFGCIQLLHREETRQLYSEETLAKMEDQWTVNTANDASAQLYKVIYEEE